MMSNNIKNGQFRKLFLIIPFMCILSCWDNNDPNNGHHYYFEGIYPDFEIGRELILVDDGDTLTNKKVDISSHGMKKAVFTFENVITDDAKTVLAVDLIELVNPDNNAIIRYLFEGIYSTKNRSIQYSGFIERLLLVLNLKEE